MFVQHEQMQRDRPPAAARVARRARRAVVAPVVRAAEARGRDVLDRHRLPAEAPDTQIVRQVEPVDRSGPRTALRHLGAKALPTLVEEPLREARELGRKRIPPIVRVDTEQGHWCILPYVIRVLAIIPGIWDIITRAAAPAAPATTTPRTR